jgi:hypothetical protein
LNPFSSKTRSSILASARLNGGAVFGISGRSSIYLATPIGMLAMVDFSGSVQTAADILPPETRDSRMDLRDDWRFGRNMRPHLEIIASNEFLSNTIDSVSPSLNSITFSKPCSLALSSNCQHVR